jgi:hypothetical protein
MAGEASKQDCQRLSSKESFQSPSGLVCTFGYPTAGRGCSLAALNMYRAMSRTGKKKRR